MTTTFFFPEMFRNHIDNSNLKLPKDFENFDPEKFPHFNVFILTHLGNTFDVNDLKENANIIASIPEENIRKVSYKDLIAMGVTFSYCNTLVGGY